MLEISDILKKHYEMTFEKHGPTGEGVDWGSSQENLLRRYQNMLNVVKNPTTEASSFLDVGCGFGGLYGYAVSENFPIDYTGLDISGKMIDWAQENFPEANFHAGDFLKSSFKKKFDYVVCNGILTQKLNASNLDMDDFAKTLIKKMFECCSSGIAFNVMSTKVNFFSSNLYYRNPSDLLSWCMNEITSVIRLDHSYPMYEYTLYLYRKPE